MQPEVSAEVKHKEITPENVMKIGMGFMASKILLTAVKLDLFTFLGSGPKPATEVIDHLKLHKRGAYDFLDALVALHFLNRDGLKETAVYRNTDETDKFLDKNKQTYLGGLLVMANNRLYRYWGDLEEGLATGKPQNEAKEGGDLFEKLYADENKLREFLNAMAGVQMGNFIALSKAFDFSKYKTHVDMGGAGGFLAAHIAINNPHMSCSSFDLPKVGPIAQENMNRMQLGERVKILTGDFFKDAFPKADVITMGNILHDWGTEEKLTLMKKSYDALPAGGAFIAIEGVIDADRKENAFGLMMSLNMLIETDGGYDYSTSDFEGWAKTAGFSKVEFMRLTGAFSAAIAYK